ncbi:MAG: ABC transporter ATP-binding protein [Firmicutes bacterium]|nr:ABC transporter ATP-binding protein [Bacillota bacterium]
MSSPAMQKTTLAVGQPMVQVEDLVVRFPIRSGGRRAWITPVDHVNFTIGRGEVLALVGESGSGKTTIGKALMRIVEPSAGKIVVGGKDVSHIKGRSLADYREDAQMIFQDPFGSLNAVKTVEQHLYFPLKKHRQLRGDDLYIKAGELLELVGLTPVRETRIKFPNELSGGQRQRVAIARALAVDPKFLVADEPISMLDVSIRAGVLKLMNQLKDDFKLSYLYITHDLASARYFGDRIMVMYGGQIMETADSRELIRRPTHPYTKLLLAATPGNPIREKLPETSNLAPNLLEGRTGCVFASRCPLVTDRCREEMPKLTVLETGHSAACHYAS